MGYLAYGWPRRYRRPMPFSSHGKRKNQPAELVGAGTVAAGEQMNNADDRTSVSDPDTVHSLVPDPTDTYVLAVTERGVYVWSARQHRALQGRFIVGDAKLAFEGPLVGACWAAWGTEVILAFESGLIMVLSIQVVPLRDGRESTGMLDFVTPEDVSASSAPFDTLHPVVLRTMAEARVAHAPAAKVSALAPCSVGALVGTSAGQLVCVSREDAEILWRVHIPELLRIDNALRQIGVAVDDPKDTCVQRIVAGQGNDDCGGVATIAYHDMLDFCGIVLGQGTALLLSVQRGGAGYPSAVDGRWLRSSGAASIALEPKRMLATVGLLNGDIEHFYIGVPAGDLCPVMRRLSLSSWYFEPTDVGAANVVAWTDDGHALVVGWEKRGLCVWSVSGCRLMWTLPQVGGTLPSTPGMGPQDAQNSVLHHPMEQGVMAAAWGPEGLFLWAAPRCTADSPVSVCETHFVEFSFCKSALGSGSGQNEPTRRSMLGADRFLLLTSSEDANSVPRSRDAVMRAPQDPREPGIDDTFAWQHILIPHDYLWENWPPSRIAVNEDATYVAVAGDYGVGICSVRTQSWRVFGDVSRDSQRLRCCALAWVGSSIVLGNEIEPARGTKSDDSTYELLVFPRDHMESSHLQARYKLPTRPLIVDVRADGFMLVICEDSSVVLYKLTSLYGGSRVSVREVYSVFLPTREARAVAAPSPRFASSGFKSRVAPGDGNLDSREARSFELASARANELGRRRRRALPSPGGGISMARIFPPLDQATATPRDSDKDEHVPTQIMLLRSTGSLVLLDVRQMMSLPLLRYVEHFWYTTFYHAPFEVRSHRPIWWAYGDDGVHVCFRDGMRKFLAGPDEDPGMPATLDVSGAERLAAMSVGSSGVPADARPGTKTNRSGTITVEQWFELDPEVYPLGLVSRYGMVLGVTQGLLATSSAGDGRVLPSHSVQVKRQPVLHMLLRHLLTKPVSDDRVALQVALECVAHPQFVDSLEWLLYEAVMEYEYDGAAVDAEDSLADRAAARELFDAPTLGGDVPRLSAKKDGFPESPKRRRGGGRLFPRVIQLLRYFGEYEDVVVRCARKMDSKRCPVLFSLAGEPLALLEQCFKSGRLRTAACLLVIIQEIWGFASSTPQSLRLVSAALARGEVMLAGDLVDFLGKAARAGMLDPAQLEAPEDVSWIGDAAAARGTDAVEGGPQGTSAREWPPPLGLGRADAQSADATRARATRIAAVDHAVLKHAQMLLAKLEFRKLAAISVRLDFPLAEWLRREMGSLGRAHARNCAAARAAGGNADLIQPPRFVHDFSAALLSLHRQFQLPEPEPAEVARALESFECGAPESSGRSLSESHLGADAASAAPPAVPGALSAMSPRAFAQQAHAAMGGSGVDNLFGSTLPPPPASAYESERVVGVRAKARQLCLAELSYLLRVASAAGASDLSALFATMLIDVRSLRGALALALAPADGAAHDPGLRHDLAAALRGFGAAGYDALADVVDGTLAGK